MLRSRAMPIFCTSNFFIPAYFRCTPCNSCFLYKIARYPVVGGCVQRCTRTSFAIGMWLTLPFSGPKLFFIHSSLLPLHLISGSSFLHHSELCRFLLATHCYHLPSLLHCITLSSKLSFSENLILRLSLFLSVGLISPLQTVYWIYLLIVFYVSVLFLSILVISMCGRLSWPALC